MTRPDSAWLMLSLSPFPLANPVAKPDGHTKCIVPVLVDAVDGELEVCVLALDPDVVPREVVEAQAARARHLGLARAQVDVNLKLSKHFIRGLILIMDCIYWLY